jgi:hypothetical protein
MNKSKGVIAMFKKYAIIIGIGAFVFVATLSMVLAPPVFADDPHYYEYDISGLSWSLNTGVWHGTGGTPINVWDLGSPVIPDPESLDFDGAVYGTVSDIWISNTYFKMKLTGTGSPLEFDAYEGANGHYEQVDSGGFFTGVEDATLELSWTAWPFSPGTDIQGGAALAMSKPDIVFKVGSLSITSGQFVASNNGTLNSLVPEPATIVGMLSGLLMLSFRRVFRMGESRQPKVRNGKAKKGKKL